MTLRDLVADPAARWDRAPAADADTLGRLAAELPALPADYLAFLALSGGGSGELGVAPWFFQLWRAADVARNQLDYNIPEYLPGYTGVGSNGGGELLAFAPDGTVVMLPFVPMEAEQAVAVAPSFTHLARAFGRAGA